MSAQTSFILSSRQTELLDALSAELNHSGLLWASGYLAGRAATRGPVALAAPINEPVLQTVDKKKITVIYGSQTGNAKRVAEQLVAQATAQGLEIKLVRASSYNVKDLAKEDLVYIVISTHSAGDTALPPDDSRDFVEQLLSKRAPKLANLSFAVLALGDSSYPDFCGVGRGINKRLEELGATRLLDIAEADVDIETVAEPWQTSVLAKAKELQSVEVAAQTSAVVTPLHAAKAQWTRQNPFSAELFLNQRIVASDSDKDVRHFEISLEGSGIEYQAGDALGVWPTQAASLVAAVIAELGLNAEESISVKDKTHTLQEWLTHYRELTCLTRPFIVAHAALANSEQLNALLQDENRGELAQVLSKVQLLDFLRTYPAKWTAQALVEALRALAPRMYSIASSQKAVGEEVHLTVDHVHYAVGDEQRFGVASNFLTHLVEGDKVPVFIDANDRFRLPADSSKDVIMIGPGTGVAPFRAFLQERQETEATGRNWLFFGSRNMRSDFLYQTEWREALSQGSLHKLSVAFSRDQAHKIYVQDRIREQAQELWAWLEKGAYLYICGDAEFMAPDVHQALIDVVASQSGKTAEQADAWLKELINNGRYARDVY